MQAKITPKHLLERQQASRTAAGGTNNNDSSMMSRSTNDLHQLAASALTGPGPVNASFAQFKLRLTAASERWKASRVQKSRSIIQVTNYLSSFPTLLLMPLAAAVLFSVGYSVVWQQSNDRRANFRP